MLARRVAYALLASAPACRTWRPEPVPRPAPAAAHPVPGRVRATRIDGSRVELAGASVTGDTLHGVLRARDASGRRPAVAVPLDSVRAIEARRVSALRTGGLVLGIVAVWVAVVAAAISAAGPGLVQ